MCCHGSHLVKRRMLGSLALFVLESSMAVHERRHTQMYEQDYKQQWALGGGGRGWESNPEQSLGESRC